MTVPTKFAPSANLYLPLAESTATDLASGEDSGAFFAEATNAELASVLVLQNLPALLAKRTTITALEKILGSIIDAANAVTSDEPPFSQQVQERFSAAMFAAGLAQVGNTGVDLVDAKTVAAQDYLDSEGRWDFEFSRRHHQLLYPKRELSLPGGKSIFLSDQQARLFADFKAGTDESFHLQGYAGIGKTYLISKFFEVLPPATTMLMAYLPSQLASLRARVVMPSSDDKLHAYTFGQMANLILNGDRSDSAWRITDRERAQTNYLVTDAQAAKWLGVMPVGPLQPREVANVCRRTMFSFCLSGSPTIEPRHLPAINGPLTATDTQVLLEYARKMWNETVSPSSPEIRFPVRNVHRIKFLAMSDGTFPLLYTHIMIDESHELTTPMLQILDRCPQAVLTLGDDYQHLQGLSANRSPAIRRRHVTQSIRAGKQMSAVLNPFIQLHPGSVKEEFEGGASHPTVITHYTESTPIPDKPTTIIVSNEWGLLNWFRRLSEADATFHIPPAALKELTDMLVGLISLYRDNERPRHRVLFRFGSWDELARTLGRNHGFLSALQMLEKGLDVAELNYLIARHCVGADAPITLGRVDDVKNQEHDVVLISRDMMRPPSESGGHTLASVCAMLYTATSRAKHELIIPSNLMDWAADLGR